ncbi:putative dynactin Arp1 p62 subunit RO2 [Podospora australis]|uniref:Dynactin subunit 4 n=1 Tax=Podospora australis TaxID=1536484 RepID=A0AAN7AHB3_9PEZI|nr:putative dynactin Arp1 p62 subunit RO2 [Podospora australis]
MAPLEPYTYIQCPCSDFSPLGQPADASSPTSAEEEEEEHTFDPRAPRSNFGLYPLEYLLYCEDCHQIRCPRCVAEEIVTYYCPSCLFEVPSSNLKSEGNRCTRSCFQCPICIGPLSVTSLESAPPDPNLLSPDQGGIPHTTYCLTCSYCNWSSTEIGIRFDKPNSIHAQLAKIRNGGETRLTAKERKERRKELSSHRGGGHAAAVAAAAAAAAASEEAEVVDLETQFANLKSFYNRQLADPNASENSLSTLGDLGFSSPSSLSRIMNLYTGGRLNDTRTKSRLGIMREAYTPSEGLLVANLDESDAIAKLHQTTLEDTSSMDQLMAQPPNLGEPQLHGEACFASSLRPIPYLLRTKRSKRCPVCRHIISKPEAKIQNTRFRIRLVAGSYMPSISIKRLSLPGANGSSSSLVAGDFLEPFKPVHFVLTFKNPIFEPLKVTLGTPAKTPGRFPSKVTVLCPTFDIDANTDVWDEALKDNDRESSVRNTDGSGSSSRRQRAGTVGESGQFQVEAGKVWGRGRNWVSIVVEVVPASLQLRNKDDVLKEDEDILEIPMFVRIEWEVEGGGDDDVSGQSAAGRSGAGTGEQKEKRELAYWCVLGLGRIKQ